MKQAPPVGTSRLRSTRTMNEVSAMEKTPDTPQPHTAPSFASERRLHGAEALDAVLPGDRDAATADVAYLRLDAVAGARRAADGALTLESVEDLCVQEAARTLDISIPRLP